MRFVLPARIFDQALDVADADCRTDESHLARLHSLSERDRPIGGWVELIFRESEGCQPTAHELAELLNTSERSLRRQLASVRLNVRKLSREVRDERAKKMLCERRESIAQIAHRLGYGSTANFSHAFRLLQGLSPGAFRGKLAARSGQP